MCGSNKTNNPLVRSLVVSLLLLGVLVRCSFADEPDRKSLSLSVLVKPTSPQVDYAAAREIELDRAEALFRETLRGKKTETELREAWAALGFRMEQSKNILVLRETRESECGRGIYAFRLDAKQAVMLQAPHRFFDKRTGRIARELFENSDFAVCAWNSVSRKKIDLAHSDGYFNRLTRAFVVQQARGLVVQLHGFSRQVRKTVSAYHSDIILSNCHNRPAVWVRETGRVLRDVFPDFRVCVYPIDVTDLGGTKNYQGLTAFEAGFDGFLHLELSAEFREQIRGNEAKQRAMIAAFESARKLRQRFRTKSTSLEESSSSQN